MDAPEEKPPLAWQPFTPRGVAAFAQAPVGRLLAIQLVLAILTAAIVVWVVHGVWYPVISAAINGLPAQGQISAGTLEWAGENPARLGDGRFLALTVDLKHEAGVRVPAHIQVEFGRRDFWVISFFGFLPRAYPATLNFPFNKTDLVPWWGAWAPAILGLLALGTIVALLLAWTVLASLYCVPVWLIAFFADRSLSFGGSWRVAGASLMPGAVLMVVTIFFYGLGTLGLIELFALFAAHWIVGWVYAWAGALRAPRQTAVSAAKGNPFA